MGRKGEVAEHLLTKPLFRHIMQERFDIPRWRSGSAVGLLIPWSSVRIRTPEQGIDKSIALRYAFLLVEFISLSHLQGGRDA